MLKRFSFPKMNSILYQKESSQSNSDDDPNYHDPPGSPMKEKKGKEIITNTHDYEEIKYPIKGPFTNINQIDPIPMEGKWGLCCQKTGQCNLLVPAKFPLTHNTRR